MISRQSPEGQLLTVTWRTILSMAATVSEQYRWILTGIAAILGLMVANLDSIERVVHNTYLKWSLSLLIVSVVLASIAYLLSTTLKVRNDAIHQLEKILGSVEAQEIMSQMTAEQSEVRQRLCEPLFGPMKWLAARAVEKSGNDPFATEIGGITLMLWQAYAMWLSITLAAVGLIVLVTGLN